MKKEHDKIAQRLVLILTKLNNNEKFTIEDLVEEFNVNKRTIQRDLNERFSYLPIKKENGYYSLETYALGKLNFEDIKNFATISGIKNLYPSLNDSFIVDLLNSKINQTYLIKGFQYEDLSDKTKGFEQINIAIVTHQMIECSYNNKSRVLSPYKLVNTDGIWYLVASEDDTLKTYTFSKLTQIEITNKQFKPNDEFIKTINENKATWFSQTSIEVILKANNTIAEYFERRQLLPKQQILEKQEDGIILSTKVSYEEEILKIVKYWIPNLKIISPQTLHQKLTQQLSNYILE